MRPTKDLFHRPAMQTLEPLHPELGGQILENRAAGDALRLQIQQVEAVLKMLDPTYSVRGISVKRRKTTPWFKRGTLYRRAVDVLRNAQQAMTATEIANAVLAAAQIEADDRRPFRSLGRAFRPACKTIGGTVSGRLTREYLRSGTLYPATGPKMYFEAGKKERRP